MDMIDKFTKQVGTYRMIYTRKCIYRDQCSAYQNSICIFLQIVCLIQLMIHLRYDMLHNWQESVTIHIDLDPTDSIYGKKTRIYT